MIDKHHSHLLYSPSYRTMQKRSSSSRGLKKSYAVSIGINRYQYGIPPLRTAVNDAREIAHVLKTHHKYDAVMSYLDEHATGANLQKLFNHTLPDQIGPDDRLVFYFAGHGVALDSDEGPRGYLLPQDARQEDPDSFIQMHTLYKALNNLKCRHLLVILDSCFSGSFRWSATRHFVTKQPALYRERYERYLQFPAWQVITSASHDQKAADQLFEDRRGYSKKHSPFANALIKALSTDVADRFGNINEEDQTPEGDGVLTAEELYMYLENVVGRTSDNKRKKQTPELWPLEKHDKGQFIFEVGKVKLRSAPELDKNSNAYRGLKSYEKKDARLFFGRDSVIADLEKRVAKSPITIVLGASGTGKSSVVKAGLIPRLGTSRTMNWHILPVIRPGSSPIKSLTRAFYTLSPDTPSSQDPTIHINTTLDAWVKSHPVKQLVLVIDQLEELITMTSTSEEREATLKLLAFLIEKYQDRLRIIITLRTDFESQFTNSVLKPYWPDGRYIVPPMTRENLRDVIEGPAKEMVVFFDPGEIVEEMIDEVSATPGGLPLLSFTLSRMYERLYDRFVSSSGEDRSMTRADYESLGKVIGSLKQRADEVYEQEVDGIRLDARQKETMRRVMLRMVSFEGGNVARQRVLRKELEYPDQEENERVELVLNQLVNARLLVSGETEEHERYVEPAHDALVRSWDKLIEWIHQANWDESNNRRNTDLRFQRELSVDAQSWANNRALSTKKRTPFLKGSALLWRGDRVSILKQHRNANWMNKTELDFAGHSLQLRLLTRLLAAAVILTIAGFGIWGQSNAIEARRQTRNVLAQADSTLSTALAAQSSNALQDNHSELAALLAAQGHHIVSSPQTSESLLRTLQSGDDYKIYPRFSNIEKFPGFILDYHVEADHAIYVFTADSLYNWDISNHKRHINSWSLDEFKEAIEANRSLQGMNPSLELWAKNKVENLPPKDPGFDEDDFDNIRHMDEAYAYYEYTYSMENRVSQRMDQFGELSARLFQEYDISVYLSHPDSSTESRIYSEFLDFANIFKIAFNQDGTLLTASGVSQTGEQLIYVWDVLKKKDLFSEILIPMDSVSQPPCPSSYSGGLENDPGKAVAFHPDNVHVAYINNRMLRIWNKNRDTLNITTEVPICPSEPMVFTPDSSRIVFVNTDSEDSTFLSIWDFETNNFTTNAAMALKGKGLLSPDGSLVALLNTDAEKNASELRFFDTATQEFLNPHIKRNSTYPRLNFSKDASLLVIQEGATLQIWNFDKQVFTHSSSVGDSLYVMYADNNSLVFYSRGNKIEVWNLSGQEIVKDSILFSDKLPEFAEGYDGTDTMSPAGNLFAIGDCYTDCVSLEIGLVDLRNKDSFWGSFNYPDTGMLESLSFNPEGSILLMKYSGGDIRLWDVNARQDIGEPLPHKGDVSAMAFNLDGRYLATTGQTTQYVDENGHLQWDGWIGDKKFLFLRVWDMDPSSWAEQVCNMTNTNFTAQQWNFYMRSRPYECTCAGLPPGEGTGLASCPIQ